MSLRKASTKLIELKPQVGTALYSELQARPGLQTKEDISLFNYASLSSSRKKICMSLG